MVENDNGRRIQELLDQNAMLQAEIRKLKQILAENGISEKVTDISKGNSSYDPDQGARIKREEISRQHVRLFFSRFWGREDVYSKRVVKKSGEVGYFPQCKNFWTDGCFRKAGSSVKCQDCKMREYRPVTEQQIFNDPMI